MKKIVVSLLAAVLLMALTVPAMAEVFWSSCVPCAPCSPCVPLFKRVRGVTAVVQTTTGQRLVVRDAASFSSKKIAYLNCGTKVVVLGTDNGFALIRCGKTVGYVWQKNLTKAETVCYYRRVR